MPIVHYTLDVFQDLRQRLMNLSPSRDDLLRMACFSTPDVIVNDQELDRHLRQAGGSIRSKNLARRPDSASIIAWHKSKSLIIDVPFTEEVMVWLGWRVTFFDIVKARGNEIMANLNEPLLPEVVDRRIKFDLVFDCISNQCINVFQAMINALQLVTVGGFVVFQLPASLVNHGFYTISPCFFQDFFDANAFELVSQRLMIGVYLAEAELSAEEACQRRALPACGMNLVVGRKICEIRRPAMPIMRKFREKPLSKSGGAATF